MLSNVLIVSFQLLLSWSSVHSLAAAMGLFGEKDVEKTVSNVLGVVGLSGAMLCAVPWTKVFKGVCISYIRTILQFIKVNSSAIEKM